MDHHKVATASAEVPTRGNYMGGGSRPAQPLGPRPAAADQNQLRVQAGTLSAPQAKSAASQIGALEPKGSTIIESPLKRVLPVIIPLLPCAPFVPSLLLCSLLLAVGPHCYPMTCFYFGWGSIVDTWWIFSGKRIAFHSICSWQC